MPVLAGLSDARRRLNDRAAFHSAAQAVYCEHMRKTLSLVVGAALLAAPLPVAAQAAAFTLVNNTDIDFRSVKARRFGSTEWMPLVVVPVPVTAGGGRGAVDFSSRDCAYDLQATLPDGRTVVWSGVNLCDTKVVTLNRNASGVLWVDYR